MRNLSALGSRIHSIVKKSEATTLTGPNVDNLIDKYYSLFKLTTLSDTSRHRYVLRTISQTVTCHRQDSRIQSNGVKYPSSNIFLVWVYRTISSSSYSYHPLIFDHGPVPPTSSPRMKVCTSQLFLQLRTRIFRSGALRPLALTV